MIGTTAAIIGGVVGLAKAGASVAASSNNKKAINKTTDAQLQANREGIAAQERSYAQGLAFQQSALDQTQDFQRNAFNTSGQMQTDIYNQNVGRLDPFGMRGNAAGNQLNSMLGLDTAAYSPAQPVQFTPMQAPPSPTSPQPAQTMPGAAPALAGTPVNGSPMMPYDSRLKDMPAYAQGTNYHPGGQALVGEQGPEIVNLPQGSQVIPNKFTPPRSGASDILQPPKGPMGTQRSGASDIIYPPQQNPAQSPQNAALNTFYQTPLYQFPLQQGLESINANYAARGMLESGAAQKSLFNYGAGVAGGALGDYFSLLGNQQGVGLSAASAQAGIGQGYANSITGLNANLANSLSSANQGFAANATNLSSNLGSAYGQAAQNTGNALSNAAVANANNNNGLLNGLGNIFGGMAGQFAYQPYAQSWQYNPMMS